jgi:DNA mismatch repair ATPase MutS
MFCKIKKNLKQKMESVRSFVATISEINPKFKMDIKSGLSGFYEIMQNIKMKNDLIAMLDYIYEIDALNTCKNLINNKKCCYVKFTNKFTKMSDMGHISLGDDQVRNSMTLSKNIIITGPNAAGKTTYIKSIFTNTILSQSLGIACAKSARIKIVNVIGSFIRISDNLGSKSLFEAEIQRCNELIKFAEEISKNNGNAIFFFDEPMHSTPPIEGTATSIAVAEYLSSLPGIRILFTTHYFELTKLEELNPKLFRNLSMEAIPIQNENKFIFPYKIKECSSYQCIAIELLENNEIPDKIIKRAIEIKNKLCINKLNEFKL